MEVKELGHLVLYVRNLKRSAAFYRDVLGWRQLAPTEDLGSRGGLLGAVEPDPSRAPAHRGGRGRPVVTAGPSRGPLPLRAQGRRHRR